MATDLIYLDESFTPQRFIFSALGVPDTSWVSVWTRVKQWRESLRQTYGIRRAKELHARDFLAGKGRLGSTRIVTMFQRSQIFKEALQMLASFESDGVWIINSCIESRGYTWTSEHKRLALERLINRTERSLSERKRTGIMFFDAGDERHIRALLRKLRVINPIPSQYGGWPEGSTRNIPAKSILADPVFRQSHEDYFIQLVDFVAYALLRREEPIARIKRYGIDSAFDTLGPILNKKASSRDPLGVIR